jgi:hypothetical protein
VYPNSANAVNKDGSLVNPSNVDLSDVSRASEEVKRLKKEEKSRQQMERKTLKELEKIEKKRRDKKNRGYRDADNDSDEPTATTTKRKKSKYSNYEVSPPRKNGSLMRRRNKSDLNVSIPASSGLASLIDSAKALGSEDSPRSSTRGRRVGPVSAVNGL